MMPGVRRDRFDGAAEVTRLLALALIIVPAMAQAQSQSCGPRAQVLAFLTEKHGETRRSIGLAANNTIMEVFASDESGSWTITVTAPNGVMCIRAAGQSYETITEAKPLPGIDG